MLFGNTKYYISEISLNDFLNNLILVLSKDLQNIDFHTKIHPYGALIKFIYIILLFTLEVYAQLPTQEWVARIPGPYNDLDGPFLAVDKLGNSYVAGTHVVNDSVNILCVKYNTNGTQQWAALYRYPGENYFEPSGLALDTFGNAYVTSSYGQTTFAPKNSLLVKFNGSNGSVLWAKRYIGEYGTSYPFDIEIDRLNNIYVVGYSDTSHLVIKYNGNGDSVWVRKYHQQPARNMAFACAIDDSMNVIITGARRFCYTNPPPGGCFDSLMAAKYSSNGILRWIKIYKYNNSDASGRKIAVDQNGSIYIGGVTGISGWGVYLTLKYDRNGVQQWVSIYDAPGNGINGLNSIAMDRINNALFVTGGAVTNGVGVAATIKYNPTTGDSLWVRKDTSNYRNAGASDIKIDSLSNSYITGSSNNIPPGVDVDAFIIKYSSLGIKQWSIIYNGPFNGWDGGKSIALDYQNNILVVGTSQSGFQLSDYVLIKYSQTVGINILSNEIPNSYKLNQNYPNPFNPSTKIRFSVAKKSFVHLKIFDILGREQTDLVDRELTPSEYEVTFDGSIYTSGIYFYQLIADGGIIDTKKMIVIK